MSKYLVTSALPYANGAIHFGHVVGAYLPADVYVRTLRRLGEEVHFICGTDEHGVAITIGADKEGVSYPEYVARWRGEIEATFAAVSRTHPPPPECLGGAICARSLVNLRAPMHGSGPYNRHHAAPADGGLGPRARCGLSD